LNESGPERNGGPLKLSLRYSKRPLATPVKSKDDTSSKFYHFDMKLKLETALTWVGNKWYCALSLIVLKDRWSPGSVSIG
jgi:hypothetical protein